MSRTIPKENPDRHWHLDNCATLYKNGRRDAGGDWVYGYKCSCGLEKLEAKRNAHKKKKSNA